MITLKELNPRNHPLTDEIKKNLEDLLYKLNQIRIVFNKPMIITSGLRSLEDQKRINPKALKSRHISGQAADIADPTGEVWTFLMQHMELLEANDLYLEDKNSTPTWVHIQTVPPASKRRIFKP